jgi:RNA polymerase sigma-70 factor, ECF subfamily
MPAPLRATDPASWPDLMARAQAGDGDAYRQLLDGVLPFLRMVARRTLRDRADVEDAVQDILLTVHMVRHTYDPARPFRPWLVGIARHRLMERLRVRGRLLAREMPLDETHERINEENAAPPDVMARRALHAGLAALPEGQRQAVVMLKLQEMSLTEAADRSGQSVGALKVASHRGMNALRRLLGKKMDMPQ